MKAAGPKGTECGPGDGAGFATGKAAAAGEGAFGRFDAMDRKACIVHWTERFGKAPPKHVSVRLMRRALAHEAQVDAHGELAPFVRKRLAAVLDGDRKRGNGGGGPTAAAVLMPGSHLVREWNGRTYQVAVVEDGFLMDGRHYRSLSAIARRITGAHWSGPRFFGVARR